MQRIKRPFQKQDTVATCKSRWKDNDQYLHVNNAVYHAIFDSAINIYLIRCPSFMVTASLS